MVKHAHFVVVVEASVRQHPFRVCGKDLEGPGRTSKDVLSSRIVPGASL